jgi:hypothetical protein
MKNTSRSRNIMNRIIEADFLPPAVEETKEKPRSLVIDHDRDCGCRAILFRSVALQYRTRRTSDAPHDYAE